jgi:molybdate transport system substrate-binding protein
MSHIQQCERNRFGINRRGALNNSALVFLASAIVLCLLLFLLSSGAKQNTPVIRTSETVSPVPTQPLMVLCAASMKAPVDQIAKDYESEFGTRVQTQFGGSQTLLAGVEISRVGDLFIPADDSYIAIARKKELVQETFAIGSMRPVLVVRKGNPLEVKSLDDLLSKEARIAQGNPDAAAIGKITRETLTPLGKWEPLEKRTIVFKPTVNDVANDLKVGSVDAGLIWDAMVQQYPELEIVPTPEFASVSSKLVATVLSTAKHSQTALHFARYLTARDKGLLQFKKFGFETADGEPWNASPEKAKDTK